MAEEKKVYSVADVAAILNLSKSAAYNFIKEILEKQNPPFKVLKIGASYRIQKESFDKWLDT